METAEKDDRVVRGDRGTQDEEGGNVPKDCD